MAQTYGPKYPGPQDGLIFSFDPKNRKCWSGGGMTGEVTDSVNNLGGDLSFANSDDETAGALTTEGYFTYDGTDDDIVFDYSSALENQEATVEAWVNWNGSPGNRGIIELMDGGTKGYFLARYSNKLQFYIYHSGPGWDNIGTLNPTADTWYHVVGTVTAYGTSNNQKIYINGALNAQGTTTNNITYNSSNVRIANYDNIEWEGKIGPINIYNRSLTASEVMTNYNRLKGRFGL